MKIPSDEEIKFLYNDNRRPELKEPILWGLSNLARAMRAKHENNVHFNAGIHYNQESVEQSHWTDDQWLQAAAEASRREAGGEMSCIHCFCKQDSAGNFVCCKCGTVLYELGWRRNDHCKTA